MRSITIYLDEDQDLQKSPCEFVIVTKKKQTLSLLSMSKIHYCPFKYVTDVFCLNQLPVSILMIQENIIPSLFRKRKLFQFKMSVTNMIKIEHVHLH